jgi:hypothetical protein
MPDSPAERARRARAHARGDHVLCRPEHCKALPATLAELDPPEEVGPVEAAWQLYASSLTAPANDPRSVIVAYAMRLARVPGLPSHLDAYAPRGLPLGREVGESQR